VAQDPWRSLNHDAKAIPAEEASLTSRTFGLDGRVEFELDDTTLVWGWVVDRFGRASESDA
jgi:hypothetical protein